jgi:hypothetical protein
MSPEEKRLRELLREVTEDLTVYIEAHYARTLDWPSQRLKYERDMDVVHRARAILGDEVAQKQVPSSG